MLVTCFLNFRLKSRSCFKCGGETCKSLHEMPHYKGTQILSGACVPWKCYIWPLEGESTQRKNPKVPQSFLKPQRLILLIPPITTNSLPAFQVAVENRKGHSGSVVHNSAHALRKEKWVLVVISMCCALGYWASLTGAHLSLKYLQMEFLCIIEGHKAPIKPKARQL